MVLVFEFSDRLGFPLHYNDLQHLQKSKADRDNIQGTVHHQLVYLCALIVRHKAVSHRVVEPLMFVAAFLHTRIEREHRSDHSECLVNKVSPMPHTFEDAVDRLYGTVVQAFVVVDVLGVVVEALGNPLHEGLLSCYVPR